MLTLLFSCNTWEGKDRNIEIVIKDAQSYVYDLKRGIYIVDPLGPSIVIKFKLSNDEKEAIIDKYFELGIDKINDTVDKVTGNINIEDRCGIMPKFL